MRSFWKVICLKIVRASWSFQDKVQTFKYEKNHYCLVYAFSLEFSLLVCPYPMLLSSSHMKRFWCQSTTHYFLSELAHILVCWLPYPCQENSYLYFPNQSRCYLFKETFLKITSYNFPQHKHYIFIKNTVCFLNILCKHLLEVWSHGLISTRLEVSLGESLSLYLYSSELSMGSGTQQMLNKCLNGE